MYTTHAQEDPITPLPIKAIIFATDTITAPELPANILGSTTVQDSTQRDTLNRSPNLLLDNILYKAKDKVILSQKEQKIYLYDEAEINYQDTQLKAGIIVLDYAKNEVYAGRIKDSLGVYSQLPYFKQADNIVRPDSIRFNFDSQKALIWNSRSEQQAGLGQLGSESVKVYADLTKKENDSVYFLSEGRLTTAKDTIDPDFYIRIKKAKFVPGKKVIAGFSNLYIVDVPTPLALPFAYFPLTTGRVAGLLFPTFGSDPTRGFFFQNAGYYIPFGDYADLAVTGDFYTNSSYGFRAESTYAKRYKYRGRVFFSLENIVNSQPGFSDFSNITSYQIQISHTQDAKASPNSRLSASVNLGSSDVFRNSLLQRNIGNTQVNSLNSSISYSTSFPEYPAVNLSLTATHSQNTNTDVVNLTLPNLQGSVERIFPFAKRDGIKKGLIQNINFQYDVNARNSIQTTTEDFLTARTFDNARVGAQHRIPFNTNFKLAKYLSFSVGGNYEDVWTLETIDRRLDEELGEIVNDTIQGFDRFNEYGLNASVGTTIFGTLKLGENKKLQALRHTIRPSISYNYAPSFDQFYDEVTNIDGDTIQFTRFQGGQFGIPELGLTNFLSINIANTLEAKVRDKDSTATEPKKISILNSLSFSSGYNFEADSLQISPINVTGGTSLFNNQAQINFGGILNPYAIDNNGTTINTFNIDNGGSLFRLTSARGNISYRLDSETFKKKNKEERDKEEEEGRNDDAYTAFSGGDDLFAIRDDLNNDPSNTRNRNNRQEPEEDSENPAYATKIPWDLSLRYAITFSNNNRQNEFTNHSIMFNGNVDLGTKWKVRVSSGYDIRNKGFSLTQLGFRRDLKSFEMSFNWTPFGEFRRWFFMINIKNSILKDLKFDNRSQPNRQ